MLNAFSRLILGLFLAAPLFAAASPTLAASDAEFQRLLSSPDDPELNRQFAVAAEARGELRHALAAIERALSAAPNDRELLAEFARLRRKMLPAVTRVVVQAGASYASNPREVRGSSPRKKSDGILDGSVAVEDERTVGGIRLRSFASLEGQWEPETSELNTGRVGAESGPVWLLSQDTWLHIAPGVSVVWLDGQQLYTEASAAATLGGLLGGLTQTVTARYGWRNGHESADYADGHVVDLIGRFVVNPNLLSGDYLYLQPRVRFSEPVDAGPDSVLTPTNFGPQFIARDISPRRYWEWGGRVSYFFPIDSGRIYAGAGIAIYDRDFDSGVLDPASLALGLAVPTTEKRRDIYIEPTAHLVFPNFFGPNLDLRADYRLEDNFSNDNYREFMNHVVGLRFVGRF